MPASETAPTDTPSTRPIDGSAEAALPASRNSRAWHHSIGGKLLIAFGLIAALSIGATFLSLMRFNQIESVLYGLVEVSMPALKLSMDVQSRASDVIETAGEVGNAQDEIERFNGMVAATERIGILWQAIEKLRAIVADEQTMLPIQALVARIDSQVGDLNRTVGDGISASQAPARIFQQIGATTAAANTAFASLLDRLNAAQAAPCRRRAKCPARRELHDLRSDFNDAVRIMNSVRQANSNEALGALRAQFDETFNRVQTGLAKLKQDQDAAADAVDARCSRGAEPRNPLNRQCRHLCAARAIPACQGIDRIDHQVAQGRQRASCARWWRPLSRTPKAGRRIATSIRQRHRYQPHLAAADHALDAGHRRIDRLAVRASLRRIATRRARRQHARHRPRQPRNAYSRGRPGRAWRDEPGARRLPRQRARDPDREGSGHRGARPKPRRRPAPSRASSPT